MSADTLRHAANVMRETYRQDVNREAVTLVAVADWLEAESHKPERDMGGFTVGGPSLQALRVACTYLGESA